MKSNLPSSLKLGLVKSSFMKSLIKKAPSFLSKNKKTLFNIADIGSTAAAGTVGYKYAPNLPGIEEDDWFNRGAAGFGAGLFASPKNWVSITRNALRKGGAPGAAGVPIEFFKGMAAPTAWKLGLPATSVALTSMPEILNNLRDTSNIYADTSRQLASDVLSGSGTINEALSGFSSDLSNIGKNLGDASFGIKETTDQLSGIGSNIETFSSDLNKVKETLSKERNNLRNLILASLALGSVSIASPYVLRAIDNRKKEEKEKKKED